MRIWLDTDIGTDVDDALALAYVLRHPDLELVGISTVFGDLGVRGEITIELLRLAGIEDRSVPLLAGMGVPLAERRHGIMLGHEGLGLLERPQPTLRVREESGAPARMAELARALADTEPDMLVAIGPMTNVGALAADGVGLPPLAIMGGKFQDVDLPGMSDAITEWNWHCDPLAVQHSLTADHKTPPLIIPAEVTFRTRFEPEDLDRLSQGDGLNQALAALCRQWLVTQRDSFDIDRPVVALHDPLTTAVVVEPELCRYRECRVVVDDGAAATEDPSGRLVRVATSVDADRARAHIMEILTGR